MLQFSWNFINKKLRYFFLTALLSIENSVNSCLTEALSIENSVNSCFLWTENSYLPQNNVKVRITSVPRSEELWTGKLPSPYPTQKKKKKALCTTVSVVAKQIHSHLERFHVAITAKNLWKLKFGKSGTKESNKEQCNENTGRRLQTWKACRGMKGDKRENKWMKLRQYRWSVWISPIETDASRNGVSRTSETERAADDLDVS